MNMIPLFDYNSITDDHKAAAEECARLLEQSNPSFASIIRERFKIEEPKRLPIETSQFYKLANDFGLFPATQGYMVGADGVQIPMVAVCGDITKFDAFLEYYKTCLANE